ncbi:MAG: hypothetical protein IPJ77_03585 [Planctomycetes bacterium]|nr:hypothetical protein [Planctomycetota bacterium]
MCAVLLVLGLALRSAWRRARRPGPDRAAWTLVVALLVLTVINSATSFGIVGWPNPLMLFFYALLPIVALGARTPVETHGAFEDEEEDGDEHDLAPDVTDRHGGRSPAAHGA